MTTVKNKTNRRIQTSQARQKEIDRIKKKLKQFLIGLLCFIVLFGGFIWYIDATVVTWSELEWTTESVCITPGMTLWEVAQDNCPDEIDVREWISRVKELNNLTGYLRAGDVIDIYVAVK